jgi:hypothetical protein
MTSVTVTGTAGGAPAPLTDSDLQLKRNNEKQAHADNPKTRNRTVVLKGVTDSKSSGDSS